MCLNDNDPCDVCKAIEAAGQDNAAIIVAAAEARAYGHAQVLMATIFQTLGVQEVVIEADMLLATNNKLISGELTWDEEDLGDQFRFGLGRGVDEFLKSMGFQ